MQSEYYATEHYYYCLHWRDWEWLLWWIGFLEVPSPNSTWTFYTVPTELKTGLFNQTVFRSFVRSSVAKNVRFCTWEQTARPGSVNFCTHASWQGTFARKFSSKIVNDSTSLTAIFQGQIFELNTLGCSGLSRRQWQIGHTLILSTQKVASGLSIHIFTFDLGLF